MKVQAYLAFNGNCQQALNFYGELFNADLKNKITYEDKKVDVPQDIRKKFQYQKGTYL